MLSRKKDFIKIDHFQTFAILVNWNITNALVYGNSSIKVTPTTFYEISKISHICSIFRKSVCIRMVHIV